MKIADFDLLETRSNASGARAIVAHVRSAEQGSEKLDIVNDIAKVHEAANKFLLSLCSGESGQYFNQYKSLFADLYDGRGTLAWMPISWGHEDYQGNTDPRGSFISSRAPHKSENRVQKHLVLFACPSVSSGRESNFDRRHCAFRIVARLSPAGENLYTLAFTAFSSSVLDKNHVSAQTIDWFNTAAVVGLSGGMFVLNSASSTYATGVLRRFTESNAGSAGLLDLYDVTAAKNPQDSGADAVLLNLRRRVTHAQNVATVPGRNRDLFTTDGANPKLRPSRRLATGKGAAQKIKLLRSSKVAGKVVLGSQKRGANGESMMVVTWETFPRTNSSASPSSSPARRQPTAAMPQYWKNKNLWQGKVNLRERDVALGTACRHGEEFFEQLTKCGLSADRFFKFYQFPLYLMPEAGIMPGATHGRTINAQVSPSRLAVAANETDASKWLEGRANIEVRFAMANLTAHKNHKDGKRPSYLSMVLDSRWVWHEFGHVGIAAATGELELPFVHSVGDALAAILHDPASVERENPRWRGATFPWVQMPRRHDRKPAGGWKWCDGLHDACSHWTEEQAGSTFARPYKGYVSEQILSSTLFSLYCNLGGDSDQPHIREAAAQCTVSLIFNALDLFGYSYLVPADSVQHFVAALLDAAGVVFLPAELSTTTENLQDAILTAFGNYGLRAVSA